MKVFYKVTSCGGESVGGSSWKIFLKTWCIICCIFQP